MSSVCWVREAPATGAVMEVLSVGGQVGGDRARFLVEGATLGQMGRERHSGHCC